MNNRFCKSLSKVKMTENSLSKDSGDKLEKDTSSLFFSNYPSTQTNLPTNDYFSNMNHNRNNFQNQNYNQNPNQNNYQNQYHNMNQNLNQNHHFNLPGSIYFNDRSIPLNTNNTNNDNLNIIKNLNYPNNNNDFDSFAKTDNYGVIPGFLGTNNLGFNSNINNNNNLGTTNDNDLKANKFQQDLTKNSNVNYQSNNFNNNHQAFGYHQFYNNYNGPYPPHYINSTNPYMINSFPYPPYPYIPLYDNREELKLLKQKIETLEKIYKNNNNNNINDSNNKKRAVVDLIKREIKEEVEEVIQNNFNNRNNTEEGNNNISKDNNNDPLTSNKNISYSIGDLNSVIENKNDNDIDEHITSLISLRNAKRYKSRNTKKVKKTKNKKSIQSIQDIHNTTKRSDRNLRSDAIIITKDISKTTRNYTNIIINKEPIGISEIQIGDNPANNQKSDINNILSPISPTKSKTIVFNSPKSNKKVNKSKKQQQTLSTSKSKTKTKSKKKIIKSNTIADIETCKSPNILINPKSPGKDKQIKINSNKKATNILTHKSKNTKLSITTDTNPSQNIFSVLSSNKKFLNNISHIRKRLTEYSQTKSNTYSISNNVLNSNTQLTQKQTEDIKRIVELFKNNENKKCMDLLDSALYENKKNKIFLNYINNYIGKVFFKNNHYKKSYDKFSLVCDSFSNNVNSDDYVASKSTNSSYLMHQAFLLNRLKSELILGYYDNAVDSFNLIRKLEFIHSKQKNINDDVEEDSSKNDKCKSTAILKTNKPFEGILKITVFEALSSIHDLLDCFSNIKNHNLNYITPISYRKHRKIKLVLKFCYQFISSILNDWEEYYIIAVYYLIVNDYSKYDEYIKLADTHFCEFEDEKSGEQNNQSISNIEENNNEVGLNSDNSVNTELLSLLNANNKDNTDNKDNDDNDDNAAKCLGIRITRGYLKERKQNQDKNINNHISNNTTKTDKNKKLSSGKIMETLLNNLTSKQYKNIKDIDFLNNSNTSNFNLLKKKRNRSVTKQATSNIINKDISTKTDNKYKAKIIIPNTHFLFKLENIINMIYYQQYNEVIRLKNSISLYKYISDISYLKSLSYFNLKDYSNAANLIEKNKKNFYKNKNSFFNYYCCLVFIKLRDFDKAEEYLKSAIYYKWNEILYYNIFICILFYKREYDKLDIYMRHLYGCWKDMDLIEKCNSDFNNDEKKKEDEEVISIHTVNTIKNKKEDQEYEGDTYDDDDDDSIGFADCFSAKNINIAFKNIDKEANADLKENNSQISDICDKYIVNEKIVESDMINSPIKFYDPKKPCLNTIPKTYYYLTSRILDLQTKLIEYSNNQDTPFSKNIKNIRIIKSNCIIDNINEIKQIKHQNRDINRILYEKKYLAYYYNSSYSKALRINNHAVVKYKLCKDSSGNNIDLKAILEDFNKAIEFDDELIIAYYNKAYLQKLFGNLYNKLEALNTIKFCMDKIININKREKNYNSCDEDDENTVSNNNKYLFVKECDEKNNCFVFNKEDEVYINNKEFFYLPDRYFINEEHFAIEFSSKRYSNSDNYVNEDKNKSSSEKFCLSITDIYELKLELEDCIQTKRINK